MKRVLGVLVCLCLMLAGQAVFAADPEETASRLGKDVDDLEVLAQELHSYRPSYADGLELHRVLAAKAERCALHMDACRDLLFLAAFSEQVQPDARERFVGQVRLGLDKHQTLLQRQQLDLERLNTPELEADPFVTRRMEDMHDIVAHSVKLLDELVLE